VGGRLWEREREDMFPCSEAQTFVRKYCSSQGCIEDEQRWKPWKRRGRFPSDSKRKTRCARIWTFCHLVERPVLSNI
jgi:hypothetical protein